MNTFRPRQNGRYFADDIFKYIFLNENVWMLIKISLKKNCGLRMHRECRERFPRNQIQSKPLVNDPGMHHGMHVGIFNPRWRENVSGIPGACATHNFT